MKTALTDIATIGPIRHREAMALAATEYDRFHEMLRGLEGADWEQRTDCPEWNVRQMAGHLLGELEANASMREGTRQMLAAARRKGPLVDELSALQVREHEDVTPDELVARFGTLIEPAVKGRRRTPAPMRALPLRVALPYGKEWWKYGFLTDIIYTRDPWMHRVDITRATGRNVVLTADHDGRIVADIVAEWARRHGQACTLVLEGTAGGAFATGTGGEEITMDAVEFCRTVSGRADGTGLLATPVAF